MSDFDAQRLLNIIDERIKQHLAAGISYHHAVVESVSTSPQTCQVYLYGATDTSGGFFWSSECYPEVGDTVRVAINRTSGDRWVDAVVSRADIIASGVQVGPASGQNLALDDDQIQSLNNAVAAGLFLNPQGGVVHVGDGVDQNTVDLDPSNGRVTASEVRIVSNGDATLAGDTHGLQIGGSATVNLAIDGNEIQARNNGAADTLYFQKDGGDINFGSAAIMLNADGGIDCGSLAVEGGITANSIDEPLVLSGNNFIEFNERSAGDPATGGANTARLYIKDNGSGKSVLRVRFNSGIVTLATEP